MQGAPAPVHIACLCAAWCRTCDDYESVLAAEASTWRGRGPWLQWHWIDIEDHADLIDDFDVETFPTLLVFDDTSIRFAGTVTPHAATLHRLVQSAVGDAAPATVLPPDHETQALVARLRSFVASRADLDLAPRVR